MTRNLAWLALAALLAGCAGEPQIVLGDDPATMDELDAQMALQRSIDRIPPIGGNRVALLRDGGQAFPAMFAAMAAAKDSINLEYYTFDNVSSEGRTLGEILLERLGHGVAVNVIYDKYGSSATKPAFLAELVAAGAVVTVFNAGVLAGGGLSNPNDRDHRKIMVVDGRIAFVGGINLDHVYENAPTARVKLDDLAHTFWRDTAARIEGPVVGDIQRVFFHTWESQKGVAIAPRDWFPAIAPLGSQTVRILASTPDNQRSLFYASLLRAVRAARHSIGLSTGYFVPTQQEKDELIRAVGRGVKVRLVLPSFSDSASAMAAGHAAYDDLLAAGVEIYEVQNAVLHSKFVVIDGVWLAIGSSNIDRRSIVFNNEIDAIVLGPKATDGEAMLDQDVRDALKVELAAWRARPISDQLYELRVRLWQFML